MRKLLIATKNPAKFNDIKSSLSNLPFKFFSLKDLEIKEDVIESETSFEENAKLKALFYSKKSGLLTLSDDGGIEIDYFNGEPGVRTRRWIDNKPSSDDKLIKYTLVRMHSVPENLRGAQLRVVLCLATPKLKTYLVEGQIRGIIAEKPYKKYKPGFPFDALLYFPNLGKYYYQLKYEDNNPVNHRTIALSKMHPVLDKLSKVVQ